MSSTPPSAFSHCCATSSAVRPGARPSATRSARLGRTSGPCLETSHSLTMCATIRASMDLPTPGAPESTTCGAGSARPPAATRRRFTCSAFTIPRIFALAASWPMTRASASSGSYGSFAWSDPSPPRAPSPPLAPDPAGFKHSHSSSSFSSSTFFTSSTGTKIPNPGLHRNRRSPSYFPSHSLVARFSSRRMPTTTPPPANSAGPTNITVPRRPPTSARSPMYTLFAFGLIVAMSSCFCKRARRSSPASESSKPPGFAPEGPEGPEGCLDPAPARAGTAGTRLTAGGTSAGALRGCAGAARPGAPPFARR